MKTNVKKNEMALSRRLRNISKPININAYLEYCTKFGNTDIGCIQQFVSESEKDSIFISNIYISQFLQHIGATDSVELVMKRLNKLIGDFYTKMENASTNRFVCLNNFINSFVKLAAKGIDATNTVCNNVIDLYSELKQINIENGFEFDDNEKLKQTSDPRRRYVCGFTNGELVITSKSYEWIIWSLLTSVFKDVAITVNRTFDLYGFVRLESSKSNIKLVSTEDIIAQWKDNTTISDRFSEYENYGFSIKERNCNYSRGVKCYECKKTLNINGQVFEVVAYVDDCEDYVYNSCILFNDQE